MQRNQSCAEGGLFDGIPREMLYKLIHSTYSREIQTIDLFRTSDVHFLSELIVHVRPYHAATGEMIYEMGDIATEVSFIIRGSVRITAFGFGGVGGKNRPESDKNKASPDGELENKITHHENESRKRKKQITYSLLGYSSAGGYFGDLEFVKKSTRIARYVATDSCSLIAITYEKLNKAIAKYPEAGGRFLAELKSRYDNFQVVQRETFATNSPIATAITPKFAITESTAFIPSRYRESLVCHPPPPSSFASPSPSPPVRSLRSSVPLEATSNLPYLNDVMTSLSSTANQNQNQNLVNRKHSSSTSLILAKPKVSSSSTDYRQDSSAPISPPRQRGVSLSSHSSSDVPSSISRSNFHAQRCRRQSYIQILTETVFETFEELNHPHSEYHPRNLNDECIAGVKVDELWLDGKLLPADSLDFQFSGFGSSAISRIKYLMIRENKEGDQQPPEYSTDTISNDYIIHPKNKGKLIWDGLVGWLIVYSIMVVPMELAFFTFEKEGRRIGLLPFDLCIDFMFFFDILLTFNTAYYSDPDDAYIAIRSRIISKYVQSWFIVDLISCIPFNTLAELATTSNNSNLRTLRLIRIIRLLRLVKLIKIVNFVKIFYRLEDLFNISPSAMSLIATIIQVIYTAHLISCMWWGLCTNLTTLTWYDSVSQVYIPLREASFQDQYVASLYWTVTTLTTVGYGDIVPINNKERILAIFIMVIGATVFGYVVANISTIIGNFNELETRAADRLSEMTESMRDRNCPDSLIKEITNHYIQVFKHGSMFDEDAILSRLPVRLRQELLFVQHKSILEKIPLFQYIKNVSLKLFLLSTMKSTFVGIDRQILKEGGRSEELIFIVTGKCLVCRLISKPPPTTTSRALSKLSSLFLIGKGRIRGGKERKDKDGNKNDGTTSTPQNHPISNTMKIQTKVALNEKGSTVDLKPSLEEHMMDNVTKNIRRHYECRNKANAVRSSTDLKIDIFSDTSNTDIDEISSISKRPIFQNSKSQEKTIDPVLESLNYLEQFENCSVEVNSVDKLSEEKRERARCNWMKVKSQLSLIARIHKLNVKETSKCANPATIRTKKRPMKSINMLIDVNGHLERMPCDVEPLGIMTAGSFVGHMAMMQDRTHTSSLVVTEPCHYYTLQKNDIIRLLRDQPGLAIELQSALSSAIHEEAKREEVMRRKIHKSNFLDGVKEDFLRKETAMLVSRKKLFGKMTLSLSRTAKLRAKKKLNEEYRGSNGDREWSGKCERGFRTIYSDREDDVQTEITPGMSPLKIVRSSTEISSMLKLTSVSKSKMTAPAAIAIGIDIDSSNASEAQEKIIDGIIQGHDKSNVSESMKSEEGEGGEEWMSRNTSTENLSGKIRIGMLGRYSPHGSIGTVTDLGEGYGRVSGKSLTSHASSTNGGNYIKVGKRNTFWQGMGESSQMSKKAKQQLADKMMKLDKLQVQYLALIDEYGSDAEQEVKYILMPSDVTNNSTSNPGRRSLTSVIEDHASFITRSNVNKNENNSCNDRRINEIVHDYHNVKMDNIPTKIKRNEDKSSFSHDNPAHSIRDNNQNNHTKIYSQALTSNMSSSDNNSDVAYQIRKPKSNDDKFVQNVSFPITSSSSSLGGLELGCCKIEEDKEFHTMGQTLTRTISLENITVSYPGRNETNIHSGQNSFITPNKISDSTDSVITIWGLKSKSPKLKSFHDTLRSSFIIPVRKVIVNHKRKVILRKKHRSYSDLLDIDSPSMRSMKESLALADTRSGSLPRGFNYAKSVNSPMVQYPSSSSPQSGSTTCISNNITHTRTRRNSYPSKETDFWRIRISAEEII